MIATLRRSASTAAAAAALNLVFEARAEPLLDRALIVQVAAPGEAFDAGEHLRGKAQSDGGALSHIRAVQRRIQTPSLPDPNPAN